MLEVFKLEDLSFVNRKKSPMPTFVRHNNIVKQNYNLGQKFCKLFHVLAQF